MNAFIPFIAAALALAVLTVVWLTQPWWRPWLAARRADAHASRRPASADFAQAADAAARDALNAAIYRDQFGELDRDRAAGLLDPSAYDEAANELRRRLLDDVAVAADKPASDTSTLPTSSRRKRAPTWFALILLLPLAAASLYLQLGTPAGVLDPEGQARRSMSQMEDAVATLAQKLDAEPDNPQGWAMLARSYGVLGRWDQAIAAFERVGPALERDPSLLATYAEVRFRAAGNDFTPEVRALVAKALAVDPEHMHALLLAGSDAFRAGQWAQAIRHWERLQAQLDPASDDAREIGQGLAQARAELAAAGGKPAAASAPGIAGRLELAPALRAQAKPDATVFLIARAVGEGEVPAPRMPLAAQRLKVSDLPYDFRLDDSMAMTPAMRISAFNKVRVEARVSASGNATPASGDLIGESAPLSPGGNRVVVSINRRLP